MLRVEARGHKDLVTVVGHAAGEWVQLSGTWTNDRSHGLQFRAGFLKASPPTTPASRALALNDVTLVAQSAQCGAA